ncbi:MAG: PAS domain S-box protein [Spartobacteria bacterium]
MKNLPPWRLLIAEDSAPLQASLLDSFSSMPNIGRIDQTYDVPETLKAIRKRLPDLVLLDLRMPGGSSFEVLSALQTSSPDPVVLIFSAEDDPTVRERCLELGAHGFFSKHSDTETLRQTLEMLSTGDLAVLRSRRESIATVVARKSVAQELPMPADEVEEPAGPEGEKCYELLFEQNPMPMFVYDQRSYRFLATNLAARRHYGYSRAEFLVLTVKDIWPSEDIPGLVSFLDHGDPMPARIWRHRKKDNSVIFVEVTNHAFIFAGKPARLALISDVTERLRVEAEARASADQMRNLVNSVEGIVWEADANTFQFTFVSRQAEKILGHPLQSWYEEGFWGRNLHPEDREVAVQICFEATRQGRPHELEYRMMAADGRIVWFKDLVNAITVGGAPQAIRGILIDITKSKEAETALRQSENLFRELANAMPQMVWCARPDGTVDYVNERTYTYAGLPPNIVGPIEWQEIVHPDDLPLAEKRWARATSTGEPYEVQFRLRGLDGIYRRHLARALPVRDEMGEIVRWFGTNTDIEEQLRVQTDLSQAQRVARLGTWSWDLRTDERLWSDELYRVFGLSPALHPPGSDSMMNVLHPDDRATYFEQRDLILSTGETQDHSYRIILPDGQERIMQLHAAVERNDAGELIRVFGAAQDVTEAKLAEQHLREQAELLALSRDAIVVRDLEDHVRFWNRGAEKIYGWTAAEAVGRKVTDFVFAGSQEFKAAKKSLLRHGEWNGLLRQKRKDGSSIIADGRWTLVRDENGQPKSVLVVNTDVTELKKMEEQSHRAHRLESIGTLASGVAHDLNNILVPILMVAPLLRGKIQAADRDKFLDIVQSSAERGASIVKQVLTFARGAEGDHILLQPIYLLQEIARIGENTFPKEITIRTRYHEDVRALEADPAQLHQILLNLAVNARDAMPAGGVLTLAADNFDVDETYAATVPGATAGPHVLLQVTDTGTGISSDVINHIFDPFFTTKEIGVGTGLGLSTIAGIVKSYGGFIHVYSEPGFTSFKVFLPIGSALEVKASPPPFRLDRGGQTILVVDDDAGIRNVTRAILMRQGYSTMVATDGAEATSLFARHSNQIAAVISDISMPGIDGLTLIRTLRQMQSTVKIILATGRDDDCSSEEVEALGVDACLAKPFSRSTLLSTLEEVLALTK